MFQFLPMLAGLLQGNQQKQEQQKQDKISAMLGHAPMQKQGGGGGAGGLMGMAGGLMGGMGGKPEASGPSGDDMLQGMYGNAGGGQHQGPVSDEDLLSMHPGHKEPDAEPDNDVDDYLK
jgi:hypothetical protein